MTTTLREIEKYDPCKDGWRKLLKSLNKKEADDEPLSLMHILESNGIVDAIWCLRCVKGEDKKIRLFTIACAREVQHLMCDKKSIQILDMAERFANSKATDGELIAILNEISKTKNIANKADQAGYDTATYASIGESALSIANDAVSAATTDQSMTNDHLRGQAQDKALEKQKELFIHFFREDENK